MNTAETLRILDSAALCYQGPEDAVKIIELLRADDLNADFFFQKLQDCRWIIHLQGRGFFENVPKVLTHEDGSATHPRSPALAALARLASFEPSTAATIYSHIDPQNNLAVTDQILRGISQIKDDIYIPVMVPVVCRLLISPSPSTWVWIQEILRAWLKADAIASIIKVLASIADACLPADSMLSQEGWRIAEIDREIISALSLKCPNDVMECIFLALSRWAAKMRRDSHIVDEGVDREREIPDSYFLESLKEQSSSTEDPTHILSRRLFLIGAKAFESLDFQRAETVDTLLRSDRWELFQRIRWQLYTDYPVKSLQWARQDVIERIPLMGKPSYFHKFEFAQMLSTHAELHKDIFLNQNEVSDFVHKVCAGPVPQGEQDQKYQNYFQRTQLYPIRTLLKAEELAIYEKLSEGKPPINPNSYKPFSSGSGGVVQFVPPKLAGHMHSMADSDLWIFLNTWEPAQRFPDPDNWLVEENIRALGGKFAEYVEASPERFDPKTEWWKNLYRPEILCKILERLNEKIGGISQEKNDSSHSLTEHELRNGFGVAQWIAEQKPIPKLAEASSNERQEIDWNWPRVVVVKFLTSLLESLYKTPNDLCIKTGEMLRLLFEGEDLNLTERDRPWEDDWLTTGINSVRGTALIGLLHLSLAQKKLNPATGSERWIFDVIERGLRASDQSPAVFAILGAHMGLFVYTSEERLKNSAELLLPPDRSSSATAFILAHYRYHRPMPGILKLLPELPQQALTHLRRQREKDGKSKQQLTNYSGRLGYHFAYYYWNNCFQNQEDGERILDSFFEIASPVSRGTTIGEIGRTFKTANRNNEHEAIFSRVMRLWERRVEAVKRALNLGIQKEEFEAELGEFINWIACECLPFGWRYQKVIEAFTMLEKRPRSYALVETLEQFSESGDNVKELINIFYALVLKPGDNLHWSYKEGSIKRLLHNGLNSSDADVRSRSEELQENLLRQGYFEYLKLDVVA